MNRALLISGTLYGMLGIVLGAFAAHGLEKVLSAANIATFETGVRYQMYSALFLLILTAIPGLSEKVKKACFYLTVVGIVLFSGSIYLLATNSLFSFDFGVIAPLTPIGGTLLIIGWIVLLISAIKLKKK